MLIFEKLLFITDDVDFVVVDNLTMLIEFIVLAIQDLLLLVERQLRGRLLLAGAS